MIIVMNNYFKMLIVFCVLLLTGCSVDYKLYIYSSNIAETIEVYLDYTGLDVYEVLNSARKDYGSFYDIELYTDLSDCEDDCTRTIPIGISTYKEYNKIKEYTSSKVIDEYFGKVFLSSSNGTYMLSAKPSVSFYNLFVDNVYNKASVDNMKISVYVPYNVVSNNADSVVDNWYIYNYNDKNYDKEINITYTLEDVSIKDSIDSMYDSDDNSSFNSNNLVGNNSNVIWLFVFIVIILIIVMIYFVSKKRKNDSL